MYKIVECPGHNDYLRYREKAMTNADKVRNEFEDWICESDDDCERYCTGDYKNEFIQGAFVAYQHRQSDIDELVGALSALKNSGFVNMSLFKYVNEVLAKHKEVSNG